MTLEDNTTGASDEAEEVAANDGSKSPIDRRSALKAGLGGAVFAAAWSAPKIEHLSLAPEYAAAASCNGGNLTFVKNSNDCGYYGDTECWGGDCCNTVAYNAGVIAGNNFALAGNIGGSVNADNGFVNLTVNGIRNTKNQTCTVQVGGNCNNGGSLRIDTQGASNNSTKSFTFNANGNTSVFIDCNGGGVTDPNATLRLSFNCVCR